MYRRQLGRRVQLILIPILIGVTGWGCGKKAAAEKAITGPGVPLAPQAFQASPDIRNSFQLTEAAPRLETTSPAKLASAPQATSPTQATGAVPTASAPSAA